MKIGFDAKRAFHNSTGLGYYSRTLINLLSEYYPDNEYYLFNTKPSSKYDFPQSNVKEILPSGFPATLFRSAWRSKWVVKDVKKLGIDLYHGLSHEIPVGIDHTGAKSIVTIHDLIHERYPNQYNPIDVKIYTAKYKHACQHADRIIAISEQTKQDIIDYYGVAGSKIDVCYQSCSPLFAQTVPPAEKKSIAWKYHLPEKFFLSVGTINERKNMLNVCKAMFLLRNDLQVPLVVIGKGSGGYYKKVKDFILQNNLEKKIIFLSEMEEAKTDRTFLQTEDLPAIYQQATAMLYPSFFEGFGAPIMEALWSRLPVITSNVSCMPEVGGDAAWYVNPASAEEIAEGMRRIHNDPALVASMQEKGWAHAQSFAPDIYVHNVMNIYKSV
ncbi:glycosyltransferase family 4 protein [Terrimonas sp. NA20]|uniref:Glycosyltransferase family 4 protein n=1 Tax=Terrimonas ginsenosidimutans TaxID=2908004 RepID=A0ABS9KTN2_9BACT|nr:glycosyltransferase family 1 protein [Terrimonas ginsenosidimutans]MCG2615704.1 glycosyltransferase family 4 protein [Terrimonas ginsenosidimutans]